MGKARSKAAKRAFRKAAGGRPRAFGHRYPSGDLKAATGRARPEGAIPAGILAQRARLLAGVDKLGERVFSRRAESYLGVMRMLGRLTEPQYQAGVALRGIAARHSWANGSPSPFPSVPYWWPSGNEDEDEKLRRRTGESVMALSDDDIADRREAARRAFDDAVRVLGEARDAAIDLVVQDIMPRDLDALRAALTRLARHLEIIEGGA